MLSTIAEIIRDLLIFLGVIAALLITLVVAVSRTPALAKASNFGGTPPRGPSSPNAQPRRLRDQGSESLDLKVVPSLLKSLHLKVIG